MNILLFREDEWGRPLDPTDERCIHVQTVLKSAPGDVLRVGLVGRGIGTAVLAANVANKPIEFEFPEVDSLVADPGQSKIGVLLGHPRIPVLRRLCRDLASLGVADIAVCGTELSEKSYFSSSFWTETQYSAEFLRGAMQGGLSCLPRIQGYWSVRDWLQKRQVAAAEIILDLDQSIPPLHGLLRKTPPIGSDLRLAVGPERGWTEKEVVLLSEAGFQPARLGRQILRTETAAILAVGIARHLLDSP